MVKECCKFNKFKKEEVCDKCNVTPVPDNHACCAQIVATKRIAYSVFNSCCL